MRITPRLFTATALSLSALLLGACASGQTHYADRIAYTDGVGGEYHFGDAAWKYVRTRTGVDLHGILKKLASENKASA